MSNVTDIRKHPKFRPKLDPDSPTYERDRYERHLNDSDVPPGDQDLMDDTYFDLLEERDPLEDLEERPMEMQELLSKAGLGGAQMAQLSICSHCELKKDRRSWWRRFFLPDSATVMDLLCTAFPRKHVRNPITGRVGYLPEGTQISSHAQTKQAFAPCLVVNPIGTCRLFKPKITYR